MTMNGPSSILILLAKLISFMPPCAEVNTAEELCFFPIDNRRRARQSVESLRAKIDETAAEALLERFFWHGFGVFCVSLQG